MGRRDYRKAFSTPIVIDAAGRTQMLSVGTKAAYSYDPATGQELWKVPTTAYSPASRPSSTTAWPISRQAMANPKCWRCGQMATANCPRARSSGGLPARRPAKLPARWTTALLFMVNESGIASCFQTADGADVWRERIGGDYSASVLYGDGRIYCFKPRRKSHRLEGGRTFESLATNELAGGFMASPAVFRKALYLRTKTDLYRIEEAERN